MLTSVLDIFEETARKFPDKTVCIDPNERMSYAQLEASAKTIGAALCEKLNMTKKPVVLFMEKSCKCLSALLGTLYSGNFYVPMDTKTPLERLNSILTTLETDFVIASGKDLRTLERIGYKGKVLVYEELAGEFEQTPRDCLDEIRERILDTDLMYIIFTSGSTGVPKGVAIRNRGVLDYIDAFVSEVGIKEDEVVGNQAPFYNDMSIRDIFMPIKVGATICILPQTYFMSPKKLLGYMQENGVTFTCWAPTAYGLISQFDGFSSIRPDKIRKILYSGEVMPMPVLKYWRSHYPNAEFYQLYGPTEITGVCLYHKVAGDYGLNEKIPLGKPFRNTGVMLLDEEDKKITPDMPDTAGEICVYGTCLAAGYYNNPEKTKEAFVQNPFVTQYPSLIYRTGDLAKWDNEGNLIFVSRKDYQVKHSARRVELGEVEAIILTLEEVKSCCCVHNREKDELVLYYVGEISGKDIMIGVKDILPKYMFPTVYHQEESLPMLPNGKLNRKLMDSWANGK